MGSDVLALERWDIAVALFPFTDMAQRKPRPVVVLSHAAFNAVHAHAIVAMVTTGASSHWPSDHAIADLGPTGLSHASVVRWKIFTLPLSLVARKAGRLGTEDRGVLSSKMAGLLLG
jgi:mRNA-degrading endonuclease toxin of MazEF toxin-antitoxin module